MEANKITVIDELGNEKDLEILFTFNSDEFNKDYVVYYDPEEDEGVYVSVYDQEGHLFEVESKDEWEMIEEVFDAFMAETEVEEDEEECENGTCEGDN